MNQIDKVALTLMLLVLPMGCNRNTAINYDANVLEDGSKCVSIQYPREGMSLTMLCNHVPSGFVSHVCRAIEDCKDPSKASLHHCQIIPDQIKFYEDSRNRRYWKDTFILLPPELESQ